MAVASRMQPGERVDFLSPYMYTTISLEINGPFSHMYSRSKMEELEDSSGLFANSMCLSLDLFI